MDETKEMIDRIRESKDRELKRMRDKFDDERRKEAEKYQFEYDKLREEIQLFARKLGQEENLNKQLSMLNYRLQNNLSDLGRDFGGVLGLRDAEEIYPLEGGVKSSVFYKNNFEVDNDTNEELFNRKKAWAELERQEDEVKSNIRSLMRKAPQTAEVKGTYVTQVVNPDRPNQTQYRVPQDIIMERKHQAEFERDYQSEKETKKNLLRDSSVEYIPRDKSVENIPRDRSVENM